MHTLDALTRRPATDGGDSPLLGLERERELLRAVVAGDARAHAELVAAHLRLVRAVARRVTPSPSEDVIAEGIVGLLEAIQRFDPSRNVRLATYATHWIRARVQRFVLANRGIVGAPDTRACRRVFGRLGRVRRALSTCTAEPRAEDFATAIGVGVQDVELALSALRRDVVIDPGDEARAHEGAPSPEETVAEAELGRRRQRVIRQVLGTLPERERHVVEARALAEDGATLDQLAKVLDLSRERVRQLEVRALRRIGDALASEGLAA